MVKYEEAILKMIATETTETTEHIGGNYSVLSVYGGTRWQKNILYLPLEQTMINY